MAIMGGESAIGLTTAGIASGKGARVAITDLDTLEVDCNLEGSSHPAVGDVRELSQVQADVMDRKRRVDIPVNSAARPLIPAQVVRARRQSQSHKYHDNATGLFRSVALPMRFI